MRAHVSDAHSGLNTCTSGTFPGNLLVTASTLSRNREVSFVGCARTFIFLSPRLGGSFLLSPATSAVVRTWTTSGFITTEAETILSSTC